MNPRGQQSFHLTPSVPPLVLVAASVSVGIVADRFVPRTGQVGLPLAAIALLAASALRRRPLVSALGLAIALASMGAAWHRATFSEFSPLEIGRYARARPQPICLQAFILDGPRHIPAPPLDPLRGLTQTARTRLRVHVISLRDGSRWRPADGQATLHVQGQLDTPKIGDRIQIFGLLTAIAPPDGPGLFDFADVKRGDRELCSLRAESPDSVTILQPASAFQPRLWLENLRFAADQRLGNTLSRERAGLAAAILLGEREQLQDSQTDAFLATGTIHILSISGLHVGILAFFLFKIFHTGFLRRGEALLAVAIVTGLYTLLTGAEPPAVRATILVWVACGASYLGRPPLAFNSLALALLVILAFNPSALFRVGVQLSFLSVAALSWLAPRWKKSRQPDPLSRLIALTRPWPIRALKRLADATLSLLVAGLLIWCVTTPLVASRFYVVSPSALLLNVFLAPVVFIAMAAGFALLCFTWLLPPLATPVAFLCNLSLTLLETTVQTASTFPLSHFWVAGPSDLFLALFYLVLLAAAAFSRSIPHWLWIATLSICSLAAITDSLWKRSDAPDLVCAVVSVGHGLGVVVEFPSGATLLYDAGRINAPSSAARSVEGYLRSRRIRTIDAVVISHADVDHYNALPELLEKFPVRSVLVGPQMFARSTPPLSLLSQAIDQSGAPRSELQASSAFDLDPSCRISVLHPPSPPPGEPLPFTSDNSRSVCLLVEYAGRRLLLTGDLESPGLDQLLAQPPLDCDVVLAPHHGSRRSDPPGFLAWCTPEWVLISSGQSPTPGDYNPYSAWTAGRVLSTAQVGSVRLRISPTGVSARAWMTSPW